MISSFASTFSIVQAIRLWKLSDLNNYIKSNQLRRKQEYKKLYSFDIFVFVFKINKLMNCKKKFLNC